MHPTTDITPYGDADVARVLRDLFGNRELIDAIGTYRLGRWYRLFRPLLRGRVSAELRKSFSGVDNVRQFQEAIEPYLARILRVSTESFTVSGLEHLSPAKSYLFLSNHRDIAMDPAFVNWALYNNGFETVRIAIGDNLVRRAYIGDLMRLNKSFIVRRNLSGPREMLKAYSELSSYIRESIETGHSVWIAHREGRAKDGIDSTDPAILKMLAMAGKAREESFAQALSALHIVPVSISYEFDPCAPMKARELRLRREHGDYTKAENEDLVSITTGMLGWKGRVHLHFGQVIEVSETLDPQQLAGHIDQSIHAGQRIFDTSRLADQLLKGEPIRDGFLPDVVARFKALLETTPDVDRTQLLEIYANPLRQFTAHQQSQLESI
ncbi:MAG: hypothetical protein EBS77_00295 [Gammaproteobacteria bacterium]|nr:hypothetical protein [Gammaproteobacteria bacterium]